MRLFHLSLFIAALMLPTPLSAQKIGELVVSSHSGGRCLLQKGRKRTSIERGTKLSERDIIILDADAILVLVEPRADKRYSFKGAYTGDIRSYVRKNQLICVKTITKKYMNYLLSQAFGGSASTSGQYEDSEATVFRHTDLEGDSVTMSLRTVDSLYQTIDSLSATPSDSVSTER